MKIRVLQWRMETEPMAGGLHASAESQFYINLEISFPHGKNW
jgi:hypothetical protein